MTVKITYLGMTAQLGPDGKWTGDSPRFNNWLNVRAGREALPPGYYPDLEEALLKLAQDEFKGLKVLEGPKPAKPGPPGRIY